MPNVAYLHTLIKICVHKIYIHLFNKQNNSTCKLQTGDIMLLRRVIVVL